MPHLFSGLNQKRQGGKITNGTQLVGSKGRGSTTRILNHCSNSSKDKTECIGNIININSSIMANKEENVKPKRNNDLFNRDTFLRNFNLYGYGEVASDIIGPLIPTPEKYIIALNKAVDRWARFLKVSDNATYYIRTNPIKNLPNWNGIELSNFIIDTSSKTTDSWIARAGPIAIPETGIVIGFTLRINLALLEADYNNIDLANILTHELGHGLGISSGLKCYNMSKNKEILPLAEKKYDIYTDPYVLKPEVPSDDGINQEPQPVFPTVIYEYIKYKGIVFKGQKNIEIHDTNINKLSARITPVIPTDITGLGHLSDVTLKTKNYDDNDILDSFKISYSGFDNEIMVPIYNNFKEYFISRVSIGRLVDLRNETDVGTIYNYEELNPGTSEVTHDDKTSDKLIIFNGSRNIINNQKNIKNDKVIVCKECDPIFIDDTNFKKYFK